MPHYKLTYFDVRGLGEFIRMTFIEAGVPFEDNRIPMGNTDWKEDAPYGQLPILEVDGVKLAQSFAIARYIARQHGLAGGSPMEEALIDSMGDAFKDFLNEIRDFFMVAIGFKEGDKDKLYEEKVVPAGKKLFPAIDKSLQKSGSGFLVGKTVTWADFLITERLQTLHEHAPKLFDGYPEIPKWIEKVMELPKIKKWIEERPKSKF